jgi:DNA-binding NarL/FixJ family response regulator
VKEARLVGRTQERERLEQLLERVRDGQGATVLVSGDAGVGKTRLTGVLADVPGTLVLRGAAVRDRTPPYGPLVEVLRDHLRNHPDGLADVGPLRGHLAMLLPELGEQAGRVDRATLFEALWAAFATIARSHHAAVVLDDLQWSDEATLEVVAALHGVPLLVVGVYRSDGLPRQHPIRRLRHDLRRAGRLDELVLRPLDLPETVELLQRSLGREPAPSLARAIHDRTEGVPFFVEELATALEVSGALTPRRNGLELAGDEDVPLPDTVRDAVLISASELSGAGRQAAEVAAVAGESFGLAVVASLSSDDGVTELIERGLVREQAAGAGAFRHALTREALYADVPWSCRRALHRQLAEVLEKAGAPSCEVAPHWLGAHASERARETLLRAAQDSRAVHAYSDAANATRQALELWPEEGDQDRRAEALADYAECCQLAGALTDAAQAWRELAVVAADARLVATAQRRLAAVLELKGDRELAVKARNAAADAFAATGQPAEAAVERLAVANQRRLSARHGEAVEIAQAAKRDADAAGRIDLRIRALGIEGLARAKHDDYAAGLELVRHGLALALEHDLTVVAAELYQRLSVTLYESADLRAATEALDTALELCLTSPDPDTVGACVTCMAYVMRERGDWTRATRMCRDMIAGGTALYVAEGLLGSIHAYEGRLTSARRLLTSSLAVATRRAHFNMTIDTTAALARVAAAEGDDAEARERCRSVLEHWQASDDHHYALAPLRWATVYFAAHGDPASVHACTEALTRMASATGHADALAALAHAIAETALLEGDTDTAADQLTRAVELHRDLDMPYERAQIELRAGVVLAAAGERDVALERLGSAYRTARKLGARPLAAAAAMEVSRLGESVAERLGVRAEADADGAGLSRREREVLRLVAVGHTNREIAHDLFLSSRTVDMHVRNILRKLDCRSRVEAAGRARELGLAG